MSIMTIDDNSIYIYIIHTLITHHSLETLESASEVLETLLLRSGRRWAQATYLVNYQTRWCEVWTRSQTLGRSVLVDHYTGHYPRMEPYLNCSHWKQPCDAGYMIRRDLYHISTRFGSRCRPKRRKKPNRTRMPQIRRARLGCWFGCLKLKHVSFLNRIGCRFGFEWALCMRSRTVNFVRRFIEFIRTFLA